MKCEWCGGKIPQERVYAAKSRGQEPRYCSNTCRGNANMTNYRKRKRDERE